MDRKTKEHLKVNSQSGWYTRHDIGKGIERNAFSSCLQLSLSETLSLEDMFSLQGVSEGERSEQDKDHFQCQWQRMDLLSALTLDCSVPGGQERPLELQPCVWHSAATLPRVQGQLY